MARKKISKVKRELQIVGLMEMPTKKVRKGLRIEIDVQRARQLKRRQAIAETVLARLGNTFNNSSGFVTVLGNGSEKTNADAVRTWINQEISGDLLAGCRDLRMLAKEAHNKILSELDRYGFEVYPA